MSNLPGENYYAAKSIEIHDKVASARSTATHQAMYDMACAQNLATLALAYEQRTATLVHALLSDSLVTDGKYDEIQAEVRQRLGLGENNA